MESVLDTIRILNSLFRITRILILLNFDVVQVDVDAKIGAPASLENSSSAATASNSNSPSSPASSSVKQETKQEPRNDHSSNFSSGTAANMALDANVTGISNLNPYQTR